jgi:hypothetical protein
VREAPKSSMPRANAHRRSDTSMRCTAGGADVRFDQSGEPW